MVTGPPSQASRCSAAGHERALVEHSHFSCEAFSTSPARALWLVKWLLLIPHHIILAFLWLAFWIVTVIAFFAILFNSQVSEGLVRLQRWGDSVVVADELYGYPALGTDRYSPFTLADVPDYPARLDVAAIEGGPPSRAAAGDNANGCQSRHFPKGVQVGFWLSCSRSGSDG
jgi:hypothetical protein